jgi:hypothetical protein
LCSARSSVQTPSAVGPLFNSFLSFFHVSSIVSLFVFVSLLTLFSLSSLSVVATTVFSAYIIFVFPLLYLLLSHFSVSFSLVSFKRFKN